MSNVVEYKLMDHARAAAIMMEDSQTGQRYLQVKHFITRGVPASILTFLVVITLGYGLMLLAHF